MANTYEINGAEYDFEAILKCGDNEVSLTKMAIKRLTIRDCIFDPFKSGNIVIANSYDVLEEEFILRGDGTETIKIMFKPTPNDPPTEAESDEQKYEHTFLIVNDMNFGNPGSRGDNLRYYELVDVDMLPFCNNIPYSKEYRGSVGGILRQIFEEVLGEDSVNEDEWEDGDFFLSYIPPLSFRYIDLLHYMMRLYYVKDGDINVKGIINHVDGKYELRSISKIFSENKDLMLDAFIISDAGGDTETTNSNNPPPEVEYSTYNNHLKNFQVSTPLYDWNSNYFINYLVYGYDPMLGIHKIRKINFDDLREKWKEAFVDVFKAEGGKPKPYLPTSEGSETRFKKIRTPYPIEYSSALAEAEICNTLIYYNLQCSFESRGYGARTSGKFVDVVKTGKDEIKSDEKSIGRWFVTEVTHEFVGETYKNTFFGCKTYAGPNSDIDE
jgi:hypothetical protein